jgi:hypothetical protein
MNKDIQANHEQWEKWDYAKSGCTLKFDLRTDIKIQMVTYVELLKLALDSVQAKLDEKFPKKEKEEKTIVGKTIISLKELKNG